MSHTLKENKIHGSSDYPFEVYRFDARPNTIIILPHWHGELEFLYIKKGALCVNINGTEYTASEGRLCIINKNELHSIVSAGGDTEYYAVVFSIRLLSSGMADYVQTSFINPIEQRKLIFPNITDITPAISQCFDEIIRTDSERPEHYRIIIKSELFRLLSNTAGLLHEAQSSAFSKNEAIMKKIVQYVSENYARDIGISDTAKHVGMSRNYFCRFFSENFGEPFTSYLNRTRVEAAARLLIDGGKNVTEAAFECGYNNLSYFIKRFRQVTGLSPKEFKCRFGKA
ncbi:MAG: AraC family transcriptional regulator [Clostridiales bacterium]|nr:AraC family transcriptional regulator [Clostridiales bacterium]